MKPITRLGLLLVLVLAFALPGKALAGGVISDRVIFGSNFTLGSGETLDGNLIVLAGNAHLEAGSEVTGDVVIMGGNLLSSGMIEGSVISLGGPVRLEETAVVEGDVVNIGGSLDRADGARILGNVATGTDWPLSLNFPGAVEIPNFDVGFRPFLNLVGFTFKIFLWAALAVLVMLFAPKHTQRVASTAVNQPLVAFGLGLLSVVVLPPALILLTITILLAPVSLVAATVAALAWMFGLVALGSDLGRRLEEALKQEWAPAVSAGVGTFLLILVINGINEVIPCVGWIIPAFVGMLGLGAVLLTRFGTQPYPSYNLAPAQHWTPDPLGAQPQTPVIQPAAPAEPQASETPASEPQPGDVP